MLNATFRPLTQWPGERTRSRLRAKFKVTYTRSLDLLESELQKLRAQDIIIQVDGLSLQDIRNDGWPRSTWNPGRYSDTGVIVSFKTPKGQMSFPCDRFTSWQDNIRAIALSLEALRTVDRYGVTRGHEQYQGWLRLEAPPNGHMDKEQSAAFIAGILQISPAEVLQNPAEHIRNAKFRTHPDRGGDLDKFTKITQTQAVLCGEGGK
jgi:hypothetical protein